MFAAFVAGGGKACSATIDLALLLPGEDLSVPREVDLAYQIPKILVPRVCDYGWAGECRCYVFVGLQDVPVLVYDLLYVGVVFVVGGGERRAVGSGFWFVAKEAGSIDFGGLLFQGGGVGGRVSSLVESFFEVFHGFFSFGW